jgi:hypothetical protein
VHSALDPASVSLELRRLRLPGWRGSGATDRRIAWVQRVPNT